MGDSKFTPGPWHVAPHSASEYGDTDYCSMAIRGPAGAFGGCLQIATIISDCIDGHDANARLIAAAPELLEAAMAFVAPFDGVEVVKGGNIAKARAAIAKARGEA